jgi:hypothetical protein
MVIKNLEKLVDAFSSADGLNVDACLQMTGIAEDGPYEPCERIVAFAEKRSIRPALSDDLDEHFSREDARQLRAVDWKGALARRVRLLGDAQHLKKMCRDKSLSTYEFESLGRAGARFIPELLVRLEDVDRCESSKHRIAKIVGDYAAEKIEGPRIMASLLTVVQNPEQSDETRSAALSAIGDIVDRDAGAKHKVAGVPTESIVSILFRFFDDHREEANLSGATIGVLVNIAEKGFASEKIAKVFIWAAGDHLAPRQELIHRGLVALATHGVARREIVHALVRKALALPSNWWKTEDLARRKWEAIQALGKIQQGAPDITRDPEIARELAQLTKALSDARRTPDAKVNAEATLELQVLDPAAVENRVWRVMEQMVSATMEDRHELLLELAAYGERAAPAIPMLVRLLGHPWYVAYAIRVLGAIGPAAEPYIPEIMLFGSGPALADEVDLALWHIKPPPDEYFYQSGVLRRLRDLAKEPPTPPTFSK